MSVFVWLLGRTQRKTTPIFFTALSCSRKIFKPVNHLCQSNDLCQCQSIYLSQCRSIDLCQCQSIYLCQCQSIYLFQCQSIDLCQCQSIDLCQCQSIYASHLYWKVLPSHAVFGRTQYEVPSSVRGSHGISDTRNTTHGSDSEQSARSEIKFFFPEFGVNDWYEENLHLRYLSSVMIANKQLVFYFTGTKWKSQNLGKRKAYILIKVKVSINIKYNAERKPVQECFKQVKTTPSFSQSYSQGFKSLSIARQLYAA